MGLIVKCYSENRKNRGDAIRTRDLYVPNVAPYHLGHTPICVIKITKNIIHTFYDFAIEKGNAFRISFQNYYFSAKYFSTEASFTQVTNTLQAFFSSSEVGSVGAIRMLVSFGSSMYG